MSFFELFSVVAYLTLTALGDEEEYHPVSCNNLEDGIHWVRPLMGEVLSYDLDEFPSIQVHCSNGYMILDYSLDKNIAKYFSSFWIWTDDAASSALNDRVTWTEWFLPYKNNENMNFRLSPDCNTCETDDTLNDFGAYFMTGNYIGCMWATKAYCDMDQKTLECYTCDTPSSPEPMSGLCTHIELSPDTEVYLGHTECVSSKWNAVPSVGTTGQYCTCIQPTDDTIINKQYPSLYMETESSTTDNNNDETQTKSSENNFIELYNKDFESGTYRILESGTYNIMEDITFNMNSPDNYDTPNAEGNWYPNDDQQSYYSGADGSFVGAYSMGFFGGIAIECDDVIIDLNGHTIKQSKEFYLQQRFFSLIELANKVFVSGQGPGNFGGAMKTASNVIIQNGILGLTSHHSIHGNYPTNVIIKDLQIKDFEVAGISINGFDNVIIEDVEVGPNYENVLVTGIYTQGRVMLDRLRSAYESNQDGTITFWDREGEFTAQDIEEELEEQMDMAFEYSMGLKDSFTNHRRWTSVVKDFINPRGLPVGSTVYGIYLNAQGASVFGIGLAPGTSKDATVRNVKIHSLRNEPWETVRYRLNRGPFNDLIDLARISSPGLDDRSLAKYIGSAYSDAQVAINQLSEDWGVLGHSLLTNKVLTWIEEGSGLSDDDPIFCNADVMLHVTKGIFGLRIDSVENVNIDNVEISHLHNLGNLGSDYCGEYWAANNGGHHNQNYPIQIGYTGTEVHAMTMIKSNGQVNNIAINDIMSARGDAFGVQIFPGNELEIGDVVVSNIHAGAYLSEDTLEAPYLPNKQPRSCALDMWAFVSENDKLYENSITFMDDTSISAECITRHSDSCSFDYLSNNLDDDYVDESGNGYNFEYVTDIIECSDSEIISSSKNGNLFEIMSKTSDYHKESFEYLQHQTSNGMSASITVIENGNKPSKLEENTKSDNKNSHSKTKNSNDMGYDTIEAQWPNNKSMSVMAWLLVIFLIVTSIVVVGCIIYQKFATYDLHRSIVGSDDDKQEPLYGYGQPCETDPNETSPEVSMTGLNTRRFNYNDNEQTPLIQS